MQAGIECVAAVELEAVNRAHRRRARRALNGAAQTASRREGLARFFVL